MSAELDALFDRTDSLAGQPRTVLELPGGLTNRNYKVTTPDGVFVARFSAGGSELLAIDRDCEYRNSVTAAAAGAGAPVIEYRPQDRLLVIGYLDGRTLSAADVASERNIPRIAAACRRLHEGGRFGNDFDMFDIQRRYRAVARSRGFRIPDGYDDLAPRLAAAEKALAVRAENTVPCNNDLLPANFIDDGERVWLIDYELSGNNDPCFELGNLWSEAALGLERLDHLVACYFGAPSPVQSARARLYATLAKYCWTLWASIQAAVSDVDFDFWEWGSEKYARACAEFRQPALEHLISTVRESIRHEGAEKWPTPSR
jgi:thiamine kinase-like enzyme